jgi:hypothetical protein
MGKGKISTGLWGARKEARMAVMTTPTVMTSPKALNLLPTNRRRNKTFLQGESVLRGSEFGPGEGTVMGLLRFLPVRNPGIDDGIEDVDHQVNQ